MNVLKSNVRRQEGHVSEAARGFWQTRKERDGEGGQMN